MTNPDNDAFWDLIDELRETDDRIDEGRIMSSRCARVAGAFLAMHSADRWGLVVKLPGERVQELIDAGIGEPFSPNGKVFREWVSIPRRDKRRWRSLLREGVAFVAPS